MSSLFLDGSAASHASFAEAVKDVISALTEVDANAANPFPSTAAMGPDGTLADTLSTIDPLPEDGRPFSEVIAELTKRVLAHGARPNHPWCAAHLHPPTLLTGAAMELAIGATNQSMDSFDQAPVATHLEDQLVRRLAGVLGLPVNASGVMTSGGTASNLLGLFLAREHSAGDGTHERRRIVTSEAAHVSVRQAARVLGLGGNAVVAVPTDQDGRMDLAAVDEILSVKPNSAPLAIVATAGTTDAGAIDPLDELADRAARHGAWLHIDAAVGAAFALSDRLQPLLSGLERADSVTADLHKLWWQPIGASVLLVRDEVLLHGLREPAEYLNRPDDHGVLNLVDRSLDTSRRFDALKVVASLRSTGRKQLGAMVEHLVDLAAHAGRLIQDDPRLELLRPPQTVTVLFRRAGRRHGMGPEELDDENVAVQRRLLASGRAVVGRTILDGRVALKLTFVNPLAKRDDIADLLDVIAEDVR
jgi:L-2,4-diaminobutyrate decarboxylase